MPERLRIEAQHHETGHLVRLFGEMDLANAEEVRAALVEIAGSTVVVDLSALSFIDSSGIAALVAARQEVEAGGNRLVLRGARGIVRRVFEVLGMEDWLS